MIAAVDEEIRILIWKRRAVSDDPTREQLQKERSRLEVKRGELIDSRYDELEEFRIQQGVWGDAGPYKGYRPFGTMEKAETV
ncbi:MAG: hypothetical protein Q9198_006399 [Flavoplaca austrocitrina]